MSDTSDSSISEFLADKEYAHAYMDSYADAWLATQVKVLRDQNGWSQEELGEAAGMKQERICVLENVNYSSWNISTLRKLARAFDLCVRVSFEEFSTELDRMNQFGDAMRRTGRANDLRRKQQHEASTSPTCCTQTHLEAELTRLRSIVRAADEMRSCLPPGDHMPTREFDAARRALAGED